VAALLQDTQRVRLSIALGGALALHAVCALFGYRAAPIGAETATDVARVDDTEIEIFDVPDDAPRGEPDDDERLGPAPIAMRTSTRARESSGSAVAPEIAPSVNTAPPAEMEGAEGGYALDPSAHVNPGPPGVLPIQLGIGAGDWSRWVDPKAEPLARAARPAELRPRPASSTGGVAEALEAHDQKVGLGPAGAVQSAVHEAGYSEIAPAFGTATFSITVLRSGVIDVQLTGATSQPEAWAKVGDGIAAAIRRKPPRIPSARIGVRLGVEVVAEERWPSGQSARTDGSPKVVLAPPKFQVTEAAKESLLERNPAAVPEPDAPPDKPKLQANYEAPGVFVEGHGKVCSYKIGLSPIPISGACDPTNIGARARRVVSTKIVSQTML
jgi:hypothetical protein